MDDISRKDLARRLVTNEFQYFQKNGEMEEMGLVTESNTNFQQYNVDVIALGDFQINDDIGLKTI
jgi:hypothetical protein